MGNIIFIAVEILLLGAGLYFVPFFTLVFMTAFSLLYLWFGFKIRKILYYIIPVLFLVRVFFSVDFNIFENYYISNIKTNIIAGRGKIEKINKKFPLENIYISAENIPDQKIFPKGLERFRFFPLFQNHKNYIYLKFFCFSLAVNIFPSILPGRPLS